MVSIKESGAESGRTVILVYDYFHPDYSAGGPVTSLVNLAEILKEKITVKVLTGAYEFKSGKNLAGIKPNNWNSWNGLLVWYAENARSVKKALNEQPQGTLLYLNGVFSLKFFLLPLFRSHRLKHITVVSPRGMMQQGALRGNRIKKLIFLWFLGKSGLLRRASWHASDEEEGKDILKWFPAASHVTVIPNIPRPAAKNRVPIEKRAGELKLIYLSLITAKKNLIFLLDLLSLPDFRNVALEIVGPVKDDGYWKQCRKKIEALENPSRVRYTGEVAPQAVGEAISRNHVFVLPTFGENYGHAIVEALASFRPVIISGFTPWKDLEGTNAGYALPIELAAWSKALNTVLGWNQLEFDESSKAAKEYFDRKISFRELQSAYVELFTSAKG